MTARPVAAVGAAFLMGMAVLAQAPADLGPAVVVDNADKEAKLTAVKLTAGTRRLAWLADPAGDADAKKGPLALEVREPNSTTYTKGVLTLVPAASVESAKYDYAKLGVEYRVKGVKDPLAGTLQFKGINVLGIEGTADGKAARFSGGVLGTGVKSVTFEDAKPVPPRTGPASLWSVQIDQPKAKDAKDKDPWVPVRNLRPLFGGPGGDEKLADALPARKADPVFLTTPGVKRIDVIASDTAAQIVVIEVQMEDGTERVAVVPLVREKDGKTATLLGVLGEVDAGWKLFPLQVVKAIKYEGKKPAID